MPDTLTLTPPAALADAYTHLRGALRDLKVVTWQVDIPDMCCDEHFEVRNDSMWPVDDAIIVGMLADAYTELALTLGPLPDTDIAGSGGAWGQVSGALYKSLRPESSDATHDDVETLTWAAGLPFDTVSILEVVRDELPSGELAVRCSPSEATVSLHLGDNRTAHVRELNDDELTALATLST